MSQLYIILLATAGLWVSAIGAIFSVTGLAQLFSGASMSVAFMASALEFSKLVTAGFIYRYWGHVPRLMRYYLCSALVVLVVITSMGIFGFLSNAYQKSSMELKTNMAKMEMLKNEEARLSKEMVDTQKFIDSIPASRISTRFAFQKQADKRFLALRKRLDGLSQEMLDMQLTTLRNQTKVGPLIYVAETFGTDVDSVARLLIFLFVSIFDPLAICLVFATNLAIRLKEKYRYREQKISELGMSAPVDHRYKHKPKKVA